MKRLFVWLILLVAGYAVAGAVDAAMCRWLSCAQSSSVLRAISIDMRTSPRVNTKTIPAMKPYQNIASIVHHQDSRVGSLRIFAGTTSTSTWMFSPEYSRIAFPSSGAIVDGSSSRGITFLSDRTNRENTVYVRTSPFNVFGRSWISRRMVSEIVAPAALSDSPYHTGAGAANA